mmetsp:Transcript_116420/g.340577  ORF Transcript_116420/g.340577 Transcript_116420/m.340577 type:complete len:106 (+) Transcript_116420:340-657(+)
MNAWCAAVGDAGAPILRPTPALTCGGGWPVRVKTPPCAVENAVAADSAPTEGTFLAPPELSWVGVRAAGAVLPVALPRCASAPGRPGCEGVVLAADWLRMGGTLV